MTDLALRVNNLSKLYRIGPRERYKALRDTLTDALYAPFRALASVILPSSVVSPSSVLRRPSPVVRHRSSYCRRSSVIVGTGFHPELTGRENIYLNGAILGMKKAEIDRTFGEIVAFGEAAQWRHATVQSRRAYLRAKNHQEPTTTRGATTAANSMSSIVEPTP
jgi:lipopolysaccharide transport system ATP-binding protein